MGMLRAGIANTGLAVALAATLGLGLVAQSAFADGGHGGGGWHGSGGGSHGGGHPGGGYHNHYGPPHIVVGPGYYPRRYYYYAPGPYYYSPYYYPPAYYPPPVAYAPPVLPSMNSGYLYYCPASQAYYPQVLECTSGWVQASPNGGPPPG